MKKILLFALLALAIGACKKASTEDTGTTSSMTEESKPSRDAVVDYIAAYDQYFEDYKAALESKDQGKMKDLGNQAIELSKKGNEALAKASGKDLVKLQEYMKSKTDEFVKLSTQ